MQLLVGPKLLYFGQTFCTYACYHFSYRYLKERWGVTDPQFGILNALTAISFVSGLLWSRLADQSGWHRLIIVLGSLLYAASFCTLWPLEVLASSSSSSIRVAIISACYLLTNVFISAIGPQLDARIMALLERDQHTHGIMGRQKLWGALGHGVVGLVSGVAIERFGYPGMFVVIALSTTIFAGLIILLLPIQEIEAKQQRQRQPASSTSCIALLKPPFVAFIAVVAVAGIARGVVGNYLQQLLETVYRIRPLGYAWLTASRIFTEVTAYVLGKPMLDAIGPGATLILGVLTGAVRAGIYGFMPKSDAWALAVPIVELLKGVNSALIVVGGTQLAHELAISGTESTAQSIFGGMYGSLGNALSGLFGSLVLWTCADANPHALTRIFQAATILSIVACISYAVYQKCNLN